MKKIFLFTIVLKSFLFCITIEHLDGFAYLDEINPIILETDLRNFNEDVSKICTIYNKTIIYNNKKYNSYENKYGDYLYSGKSPLFYKFGDGENVFILHTCYLERTTKNIAPGITTKYDYVCDYPENFNCKRENNCYIDASLEQCTQRAEELGLTFKFYEFSSEIENKCSYTTCEFFENNNTSGDDGGNDENSTNPGGGNGNGGNGGNGGDDDGGGGGGNSPSNDDDDDDNSTNPSPPDDDDSTNPSPPDDDDDSGSDDNSTNPSPPVNTCTKKCPAHSHCRPDYEYGTRLEICECDDGYVMDDIKGCVLSNNCKYPNTFKGLDFQFKTTSQFDCNYQCNNLSKDYNCAFNKKIDCSVGACYFNLKDVPKTDPNPDNNNTSTSICEYPDYFQGKPYYSKYTESGYCIIAYNKHGDGHGFSTFSIFGCNNVACYFAKKNTDNDNNNTNSNSNNDNNNSVNFNDKNIVDAINAVKGKLDDNGKIAKETDRKLGLVGGILSDIGGVLVQGFKDLLKGLKNIGKTVVNVTGIKDIYEAITRGAPDSLPDKPETPDLSDYSYLVDNIKEAITNLSTDFDSIKTKFDTLKEQLDKGFVFTAGNNSVDSCPYNFVFTYSNKYAPIDIDVDYCRVFSPLKTVLKPLFILIFSGFIIFFSIKSLFWVSN